MSKGDEQRLVDFAKRVKSTPEGRTVLIFKLSGQEIAGSGNTRSTISKNALETFNNIVEGNLFFMANGDSVLVCKDADIEILHSIIERIAKVYNDDLSEFEVLPSYIQILHLETQAALFMETVDQMLEHAEARSRQLSSLIKRREVDGMIGNKVFESSHLAKMEEVLSHTDIGSILRQQSAISMRNPSQPKILFTEYYVSLGVLAQSIMPEVNITSNILLMRQLTKTLDDRLLRWLKHEQSQMSGTPFSLNMNMESASSDRFLEMVQHVWSTNQQTIVIELGLMDVFENLDEYHTMLPYLQERGYKVLIDAIRPCDLLIVKLRHLNADLYKVRWNLALTKSEYQVALGEFVTSVSSGRVIMCHCDDKQALSIGIPLKIYSYQGRFMDGVTRKRRVGDAVMAANLQQDLLSLMSENESI